MRMLFDHDPPEKTERMTVDYAENAARFMLGRVSNPCKYPVARI
jgi:hypothetical protein